MIPLALVALSPTQMTVVLGLAYLATGSGVALALSRRGHAAATSVSALAAWPVLLPLLSGRRHSGEGPLAERIASCFDALVDTLADPAAGEVPWSADVEGLREALTRADERLALVDRLLVEGPSASGGEVARSLEALRTARAHAAGEIQAVLDGVVQLRLQVGLLALAGNGEPVRQRLQELMARARALDEVTRLDSGTV